MFFYRMSIRPPAVRLIGRESNFEGDKTMRFMMIVKASNESEAGIMPSELIAAMTKYNEELMKAGVLLDLSGLQPSSKGSRF